MNSDIQAFPREYLSKLGERTMVRGDGKHSAIHADFNIDLSNWEWHQGVAMQGLYRAGVALGDSRYRMFIEEWIAGRVAEGLPSKSVNTSAPLLTVACLHEAYPNYEYEKLCREYAEWAMTGAPRLPDGTYEHDLIYPRQVWADTLFMLGLFLAKWGRMTGDDALVDQSAKQFLNHYRHLGDKRTGLLWHGYDDSLKANIGTLWGRGNGWYAIATTEALSLLGEKHRAFPEILANLRAQFAGAAATQDAVTGAWRTVMNDKDTYFEATCTAAFACAFKCAAELGFVDAGYKEKSARAYARVFEWINKNGEFTHASAGTPIKPDAAAYNAIPCAMTPFGQGLALISVAQADA